MIVFTGAGTSSKGKVKKTKLSGSQIFELLYLFLS